MKEERQKKDVLLRLKKIGGQVRGLQKMIEEGVPCPDILTQVAAVTSAVKRVGAVIVQAYMNECLEETQKESAAKRVDTLKDFHQAISRYIDWA